jgi:hypothetical protein
MKHIYMLCALLIMLSCTPPQKEASQTQLPQQSRIQQLQQQHDIQKELTADSPSVNTTVTAEVQNSPELNPPHGEPGHRCDIPVGSPLNPPVEKKEVRLNPPHGEPGHRCDIAVGSPLD